MKRRILSILLALALCLTLLPTAAWAADDVGSGGNADTGGSGDTNPSESVKVDSWAELIAKIENGTSSIALEEDVTRPRKTMAPSPFPET